MSEYLDTQFEPEPERYEFKEKPRYQFDVSRRTFVQVLGAGLLITANGGIAFAQRRSRSGSAPKNVAARLHIGDDGTITLLTGKV